jgi:toxin FitB
VKFLLDTNIIAEIRRRDRAHPSIARWVARTPAEAVGTSVLVLAEIRRGIELKRRRDPGQAKAVDRWFAQVRTRLGDRILPIDEPIAEAWARLGIPDPLPLIDGLPGATAKVHGRDTCHPRRRAHGFGRRAAARSVFDMRRPAPVAIARTVAAPSRRGN